MTQPSANAITIVIPTYNRRAKLQLAVESVLAETRVPLAIHIFDNASTDGTQDYVRAAAALDSRISYFRNETNIGSVPNYALALGSVTSEYYIPLADDDWLLPDFIFDAYEILERHGQAGAAVFVTEARDAGGTVQATYPLHPGQIHFGYLEPTAHLRDWMVYGHYSWSSILWRSSTLVAVGHPYLHVGLPSDVDFQAQIFCRFPVFLVNRPGAVFNLHPEQACGQYNLTHMPNWSALFERLDTSIHSLGLFDFGEYLDLRQAMQERYHRTWTLAASQPLGDKELVKIAAQAGFRLGDWDFAFSLLDQLPDEPGKRPVLQSAGGRIGLLPVLSGGPGSIASPKPKAFQSPRLGVLLWLKETCVAYKRMAAETARLTIVADAHASLTASHSTLEATASRLGEVIAAFGQKIVKLEQDAVDLAIRTAAEISQIESQREAALLEARDWRARSESSERNLTELTDHWLLRVLFKIHLLRPPPSAPNP